MRMPNKFILDQLYSCTDKHYSVLSTSRYTYRLYRDVMFSCHDVITRTSNNHKDLVDQISFDRPIQYCLSSGSRPPAHFPEELPRPGWEVPVGNCLSVFHRRDPKGRT